MFTEPNTMLNALGGLCMGLLAGTLHFGGLWLTLKRLPHCRRPALLATMSLFTRLAVTAALAWLTAPLGVWAMVCFAAGVLALRLVLSRRLAPARDNLNDAGGRT